VYRMANASQIPAFRIGTSWRFKQEMIDTWIERVSNLPREE
jgi:excisionase family DNA binding protein